MAVEGDFPADSPRYKVIDVARKFSGLSIPPNSDGYRDAIKILEVQMEAVLPPERDKIQLYRLIAQRDPVVVLTEQRFYQGFFGGDNGLALEALNHLSVYGEVDYNDFAGDYALPSALLTHRAVLERIKSEIWARSFFIRQQGGRILADIERFKARQDRKREINHMRALIHNVVLEGNLGKEAKRQFDPSAVFSFKRQFK